MSQLDRHIICIMRTNMGRYDNLEKELEKLSEGAKQDLLRLLTNVESSGEDNGRRSAVRKGYGMGLSMNRFPGEG